ETLRLPGIRQGMHATATARRHHGLGGGRLRCLLPVRPLPRRRGGAMKAAILRKARESAEVAARFFEENAAGLEACVRALTARFQKGGRLLTMGNGGSACDAAHVAVEFLHPIIEKRRPLPAMALTGDMAMVTAVANDTDFARVFIDQVDLLAR